MKIIFIKSLPLRRTVMISVLPFVVFQYLYLGLKGMVSEFKWCWSFQPEETKNV